MRPLLSLIAVFAATLASSNASAEDYAYADIKTNMGSIILRLDKTKAPISVANFEDYAKSGYYNGTVFHRVIGNFMIQGGGFDFHGKYPAGLHRKPGAKTPIKNEWQNGLKNVKGSVAMARLGGQPDSATNQFFINVENNDFLDTPRDGAAYAVFGNVIAGMDTVDKIKSVPTGTIAGMQNVPSVEVMIESVTIITKDQAMNAEARIAADNVKALEAQIEVLQAQLAEAKKKAAELGATKE